MHLRLKLLLVTTTLFLTPPLAAMAEGGASLNPEIEISEDIVAIATNPLASPDGAFPSPVPKQTMRSPRSTLFYALPLIGFWLIFRRRGNGVRI